MAKRCIKIALNGQVFNSGEISDFSALTEQTGSTRIYSGSLPAWVTSLGDTFFPWNTNVSYTSDTGSEYIGGRGSDNYSYHNYNFKATGLPDYAIPTVYTSNWVN